MASRAPSTAKYFSSLRRVEVRSSTRLQSGGKNEDWTSLAAGTEAVVVPLPRRPLFPGFRASAYMEHQAALKKALSLNCDGKLVAAFMIKDSTDYQGCILRPGLEGEELLTRLHSVGTLAEVVTPLHEKTGRVRLYGRTLVRMAGVVGDNPLTVRVEPLEQKRHTYDQLNGYQKGLFKEAEQAARALMPDHNAPAHWKMGFWELDALTALGPAYMPVDDKALHQQALEELDVAKRLDLSLEILRREVELDEKGGWVPKPDEHYIEEERELLTELQGPALSLLKVEKEHSEPTGKLLIAPSIQFRVRLEMARKLLNAEALAYVKNYHSLLRLLEACWGY